MSSEFHITAAQYADAQKSAINATINGNEIHVPVDEGNRHYKAVKAKHDDSSDAFSIQDATQDAD